jgi:hypothetical protein
MSPQMMLDSSIAQLQRLSAVLVDELGELRAQSRAETLEARACKEILLSITVLLPKLQAARYVMGDLDVGPCAACQEG